MEPTRRHQRQSLLDEDKWDEAETEFIQEYTDDNSARDTVLSAVTTGDFTKPPEIGGKEHYTRIIELCS